MLRRPSAHRALAVVLVAGVAAASGGAVPLARAQQAPPSVEAVASTPPTPLVGDFDGDGRSDQLWYGPGQAPDHTWYGRSDRGFSGRATAVSGDYTPLVGDFNGDRRDDVVWYAPGAGDDYLWLASSGRRFVGRSLTIDGTFEPFVGDFDGDRRSDVFWFSGTGADQVWYGAGGGGFAGRAVSVTRPYEPVVGDFDANGTSDVLWYGPGDARDFLWRGTWSRTFLGSALRVGGEYTPVVGDFGGDGHDDVYWHRDGTAKDIVWTGRRGGAFEGSATASAGTDPPFVGDFDGNGAADLGWNNPGTADDHLWYGGPGGFDRRPLAVNGSFDPTMGDFDGDGRDDIFWFVPGDPRDALWFAAAGRTFASRPATLDPLPGAAAPFRQATWATQFDPYGYVAHALGPTPPDQYGRQFGYTSSREAFEYNYQRGFRVLESDWVRLADGTVLAAHNGTERRYGLPAGVSFAQATRGQLSGRYTVGGSNGREAVDFTPLFAADLVDLVRTHPDVYIILDTKFAHTDIVREFVRLTAGRADLMDRLVPHVAGQSDLDAYRALYPIRNYVVALYRTQAINRFDDDAVVEFVRRNRAPAVMMWFGLRDPALSLSANMAQQRRYTPQFVARLRAAGAVAYVHSITNTDKTQAFAALGIGVYSNGPFPPFDIEPAPIEPNVGGEPLA